MKLRTLSTALLTAAIVATTTIGGSAAPTPPSGPPIELNSILPLTGAFAFFGQASQKTMQLVVDRTNEEGGIHGRPLKLVFMDDQSSPQQSVQFMNGLIAKKTPLVLGPAVTATCAAAAPLVAPAGPVMFCISPFINLTPYVYVTAGTALDSAVVVLRYYRMKGFKRFAMLNSTDASGAALDSAFEEAFRLHENAGLTLVAHQHFAPADQSVAAQMANIKAAAPQVLISWTVGSPFSTVLRGIHDSGLDVPLIANGANMTMAQMSQLLDFAPKELDFLTIPTAIHGSAVLPKIAAAQRDFFSLFAKANIKPDGGYANGYDMTIIAVDALKHVPADATAAQVKDYLAHLSGFAGANAVYDFRFGQRGSTQNGFEIARLNSTKTDFEPVSKPGGAPLDSITMH
jgi:branched-chain amino acid transport system substrate-binding protein